MESDRSIPFFVAYPTAAGVDKNVGLAPPRGIVSVANCDALYRPSGAGR